MPDRTTDLVAPQHLTAADTRQAEALIRAVATELRRHGTPSFNVVSNAGWRASDRSLWPLLDAAVAASIVHRRDEALIPPAVGRCEPAAADPLPARTRPRVGALDARRLPGKLIALVQAKTLPELKIGSNWSIF